MKKMLLLLVIACMVQVVGHTSFTYAKTGDTPIFNVTYDGGGRFAVSAQNLENGQDYRIFAAVYDTDHSLYNTYMRTIKAANNEISTEFELEACLAAGKKVRFFLWDEALQPLSEPVTDDKNFGVTEVAEGKSVYGTGLDGVWSSTLSMENPQYVTDGNPETMGGFYAKLGTRGHMYIDLGQAYTIDRIEILAYHNLFTERTGNFDLVLSNSVTKGEVCTAAKKLNVAHVPQVPATSAEEADYASFYTNSDRRFRYVSLEKFESNPYGLMIAEVKVYVRNEDMSEASNSVEIAQHKPTGGKSLDNAGHSTLAANIVDGDRNTIGGFYLGQGQHGYMYIDLCREYAIERIEVLSYDKIQKERAGGFDVVLGNSLPDDTRYDGSGGELKIATAAYPPIEQTAEEAEYQTFSVPKNAGKFRYVSLERFEKNNYGMLIAEVKVYVKQSEMLYSFTEYMKPLWSGDTVYNESIMFLPDPVTAEVSPVPLLFEPSEIISVKSYDLKTVYEEGKDYTVENGKICIIPEGRMKSIAYDQLYMKETGLHSIGWIFPEGRYVPYRCGGYYSRMQYYVTYKHNGAWGSVKPAYAGEQLPKTIDKLEKGERIRILVYGDSISAGGEVSSCRDIVLTEDGKVHEDSQSFEPYMQMHPLLLVQQLTLSYPDAEIEYMNTSIPGWSSKSAASVADARVGAKKADLVIIAYGMNDLSLTAAEHQANIESIMQSALTANGDTEFILVSTTLPNPESTWSYHHLEEFQACYEEIQKNTPHVAIAPMTQIHKYILSKKRFFDMTSNAINHPNDFLARIYAHTLTALLVK